MKEKKLNCWEYMKCGRDPGGKNAAEFGVCPAAEDASFDGINRGKNGGRICWAVGGTFCGGEIQGTFAEKRKSCINCEFYKLVRKEKGKTDSRSKFLKFVSDGISPSFLKKLTFRHVKAGERFIRQGEPGEEAYIIENGTCLVIVEKNGELYPSGHRGEGDIVGITSVLTGEPGHAHAEAETEMDLWAVKKSDIDDISKQEPELLTFLTEIVASRFDSKRPVPDRQIGKYIAADIIGTGGYSIVYKGIHPGLNMPVAIKMMRHDMVMNTEFYKTFCNEAQIVAKLNHRNIIRVYDIEERFKTVFIIMEYLEGQSLKNMLVHLKAIPPDLAADFLFQICLGLDYAHHHGIIHRDINTLNIFVQTGDCVKILDFGIACPIGTDDFIYGGALAYMSPEQIEGEPADCRSDIYSLGITAYEMLTGRLPFEEKNPSRLMKAHLSNDIPNPSEIIQNLPEALCRFVVKCGRCCPEERYANMQEALADLRGLAEKYEARYMSLPRQKMSNLLLSYTEEQEQELSRILDEFSVRIKESGAELRIAHFQDR
ncbi:MAG: protein kinase [Desulfobacterales bacterium]